MSDAKPAARGDPETYPFRVRRWGWLRWAVYGWSDRGEQRVGPPFLLYGRAARFAEDGNRYLADALGVSAYRKPGGVP